MCAILGIMSKSSKGLSRRQYKAFKRAWGLAQDRGTDASGYIIAYEDNIFWWKEPIGSAHAVRNFPSFKRGVRFILGHTRLATDGSPKDNLNNHPLVIGPSKDLFGIHNGMISNKDALLTRMGWSAQRGVDTEIAFRLLDHYGPRSIKALEMIQGSCNLAYFLRSDLSTVYLVRNGNPLTIREGLDYVAFGSMAHYWTNLQGFSADPKNGSLIILTRKRMVTKSFTPSPSMMWGSVYHGESDGGWTSGPGFRSYTPPTRCGWSRRSYHEKLLTKQVETGKTLWEREHEWEDKNNDNVTKVWPT